MEKKLESAEAERNSLLSENKTNHQSHTEEMDKLQCEVTSLTEEREQLQEMLDRLRQEKQQLKVEQDDRIEELQTQVFCSLWQ